MKLPSITLPLISKLSSAPPETVNSVAELMDLRPSPRGYVQTKGYYTPNDGGHGTYIWTSDSTNSNGGSKIKSNMVGAWALIDDNCINVLQWGAKKDFSSPASTRINAALEWAASQPDKKDVWIPRGNYALDSAIYIRKSGIRIRLNGTLKNVNGNLDTCLVASANWGSHNPIINDGVPVYELSDIIIDGEGVGVIDQNSINAPTWRADDPKCGAIHAVVFFGINGVEVKNLTVQNSNVWAMTLELCKKFKITGNTVITGLCNNRLVDGVPHYLGGQDGIHPHDCIDGVITNNDVISGDDAIVISAARTISGNIIVSNNRACVRVYATEADGVTLNNNSPSGRFGLAAYTEAQTADCILKNVTFTSNIIHGGQGLFCVYDTGTPHKGPPKNIRFIGNTFNGQTEPGNPETKPFPINYGWMINGSDGVDITDNTFNDIARKGIIGGNSDSPNGTITFSGNRFSNFKLSEPKELLPDQPDAIILFLRGSCLIVDGNLFENNYINPIGIGGYGDFTPDVYPLVIITNNKFINNNLRWATSEPTSIYSSCVYANGVTDFIFDSNVVSTNFGNAALTRACKNVEIKGNTIKKLGNGSFVKNNGNADAFRVLNQPATPGNKLYIYGNSVSDIDGVPYSVVNAGQIIESNNIWTTS
jgi:hypothetical protein